MSFLTKKQNVFLIMAEIIKRENQLDWACRILITLDLVVILGGYFSYFQTRYQLVSPLIPQSTIDQIISDNVSIIMKASIVAAVIFLAGLWFYSFGKKSIALFLFLSSPVCFKLLLL